MRITLAPTIVTFIVVSILIVLGTWQLLRLEWKTELIASLNQRINLSPVQLADKIDNPEYWRYRPVQVSGVFDHAKEIHIMAYSKLEKQGYLIITPLIRDDGSAVFVSRGWVPMDKKDAATRTQGQIEGRVTITGLARPAWKQGWLVPNNDLQRNLWFWGDINAMAVFAGQQNYLPIFVEAGQTVNAGGLPIGGQSVTRLSNDHLSYAITWYLLALAGVVIWLIYHLNLPKRDES